MSMGYPSNGIGFLDIDTVPIRDSAGGRDLTGKLQSYSLIALSSKSSSNSPTIKSMVSTKLCKSITVFGLMKLVLFHKMVQWLDGSSGLIYSVVHEERTG